MKLLLYLLSLNQRQIFVHTNIQSFWKFNGYGFYVEVNLIQIAKNNQTYTIIIFNKDENIFIKIIDVMLEDMSIRQLIMMLNEEIIPAVMEGLVDMMNGHYIRGAKKMKK